MKIILNNEVKDVAPGFGRYLLNSGRAVGATSANLKQLADNLARQQTRRAAESAAAASLLPRLADVVVTINAKAAETGHLFAGLHATDLIRALAAEHGIKLKASWLDLKTPIKTVGEFKVPVSAGENRAVLQVVVAPAV